jgi:uncharacterized membrane protein (UPF0127 family)
MKKIILILGGVVAILAAILAIPLVVEYLGSGWRAHEGVNRVSEMKLGRRIFSVQEVVDEGDRKKGLSGRDNLCADCAMLFSFEREGEYPFWMKEMKFDLDIVWILKNRVVFIAQGVSHEKGEQMVVDPGLVADQVVEINSGAASEAGLRVGDLVRYR